MVKQSNKKAQRPSGYPTLTAVQRGASIIGQMKPDVVYLTVEAKLHNLSQRMVSAISQVFKIATLTAQWMVRDINQRKPVIRFAPHRQRNSTGYNSKGIADAIQSEYREKIRGRFTINGNIFTGICTSLAANYASTLQKIAKAEQKGWLRQHHERAAFVIEFGKHKGKKLGDLPRKAIFGYAFLQPKREQCEHVLHFINTLLDNLPEEQDLRKEAMHYRMEFGPRRGDKFGSMRPETLRRLRVLIQRDIERMELIDSVRIVAQDFLRFTPPGLPTAGKGLVSPTRQRDANVALEEALDAYAALPQVEDEEQFINGLTEDEHTLFRELQRRFYEATQAPQYVPLRWNRADGAVRGREIALLYEPASGKYLFLAHILHAQSQFRKPLNIKGTLVDVNNPDIKLVGRDKPSIANLYELEFSKHQRALLDLGRSQSHLWKEEGKSSGAVRAATLHAYHDEERDRWWFEAHLSLGMKPSHYGQPQRVVGVHIDPSHGIFVCILNLDGSLHDQFYLNELRVAQLLENRYPEEQAQLIPQQRTAHERSHRVSDALLAICSQHSAQLGFENISYRSANHGPNQFKPQQSNSRTVFKHLEYKLPLKNVSPPIDVKGVAPRRDCGHCGVRHDTAPITDDIFACPNCGHREDRGLNTAREVARRTLWSLAAKKASKPKKPQVKETDVQKAATV